MGFLNRKSNIGALSTATVELRDSIFKQFDPKAGSSECEEIARDLGTDHSFSWIIERLWKRGVIKRGDVPQDALHLFRNLGVISPYVERRGVVLQWQLTAKGCHVANNHMKNIYGVGQG